MEVIDAHTHFYSRNYFQLLTQKRENYGNVDEFVERQAKLHEFDLPPADPVRLADRWIIEMDRHDVSCMALMSGISGDENSIKEAMRIYPDRFIGIIMVNPYLSVSEELVEHAATEWGFRGIVLYPSLHRFTIHSQRIYPIVRLARRHHMAIFVHFGNLRVRTRRWWGLPYLQDWHYANPSDLHRVATDFPSVNFVVPAFGSGTLTQLLRIGLQCPNVYVDSSSANHWIDDQSDFRDLRHVFERTLEVFGPGRILFGSDSGLFPRGWRSAIYAEQMDVLNSLGVSDRAIEAIMGQNARHVFGLDRAIPSFTR